LLRRLLEVVALRARPMEFKELEIIVLRHELAILRRKTATVDHRRRPGVPRLCEPRVAMRAVAILHRHTGDTAALASSPGRQAVDVRSSHRPSTDAA
jgi:hypothetical protein